jgi:hypothetical protein
LAEAVPKKREGLSGSIKLLGRGMEKGGTQARSNELEGARTKEGWGTLAEAGAGAGAGKSNELAGAGKSNQWAGAKNRGLR